MTDIIICDIDGTLADNSHRTHFLKRPKGEKDWTSYFAGQPDDLVNEPVLEVYRLLQYRSRIPFGMIIVTGRSEKYREATEEWLRKNEIEYDDLRMRPLDDNRSDTIIKKEILDDLKAQGLNPFLVLEDRAKVVEMWREQGLTCFQVAEGNF